MQLGGGMRPAWVLLFAAAGWGICSATCLAQAGPASEQVLPEGESQAERPTPELERARALFEEGLQLIEQQRWEQAALCFDEILKVKSSAVVAYNLALAFARMERFVEAAELLGAIVHDEATAPQTRKAAKDLLGEVAPNVGTVTLRLAGELGDVHSLSLHFGPKKLSADWLGRSVTVNPGPLYVQVYRGSELLVGDTVEVGGMAEQNIQLTLEIGSVGTTDTPVAAPSAVEVAAQSTAPPAVELTRAGSRAAKDTGDGLLTRWWFWAGAGLLVAGVTIAGVAAASSGDVVSPDPVQGTLAPGVLEGTVNP